MGRLPIAGGAYGVVFNATIKHNRLVVTIKTMYRDAYGSEEKFYKKLAKEVVIDFLFDIKSIHRFIIANI